MKKEFRNYYISRAILSVVFAILVFNFTWQALLMALVIFGLFLLYLHSGWFRVDPEGGFFPLRRDDHGRQVQRIALIAAVVIGTFTYFALSYLPVNLASTAGGPALGIGVLVYFSTQFILFSRR